MNSSSSWDMSSSAGSGGKPSPKRELQLQGPRPTPLKIRKDSHKIKKPPMAPQLQNQQLLHQQSYRHLGNNQQRPPVIIYTVSPKVIHTDPNDFMKLVQRLTGPSSTSYLPSPSTSLPESSSSVDFDVGAISPAARYASIERANNNSPQGAAKFRVDVEDSSIIEGLGMGSTVERTMGSIPSILSPVPSSLPPISPNFFSPTIDPNSLSFVHNFSPFFNNSNKHHLYDGSSNFLTSPSTNILSPSITSPNPPFDLFNRFMDL